VRTCKESRASTRSHPSRVAKRRNAKAARSERAAILAAPRLYPGLTPKNLTSGPRAREAQRRWQWVFLRCLQPTAVLASLLFGPVARAESPQLLPTRDVDITYDVTLPSQPRVRERVRWLAAEQLERVDGPHKSTTIFNRRTREIIHLSLANRTCVNWSWTEDVETRTVCMTEDGVLLRFLIDGKPISEARSVSYLRQPAELFQVPPGYSPLLEPEGGPVP
jgi:transposase InsO family protein